MACERRSPSPSFRCPIPELKKVHVSFAQNSGPRKYTLEYRRFDSKEIERKLKKENWSKLHVHSMIVYHISQIPNL